MGENIRQHRLFPYDGQQDSSKHPLLISPVDVIDSNNCIYTTYSTKKIRPGISDPFNKRVDIGNSILSGVDFFRLGEQRQVVWDGNNIKAISSDGSIQDISGGFELPSGEVCNFLVFSGYLLMFWSGATIKPKGWTMTGAIQEISADIPNAPFGRVFLNSLWVPDPSVPGRLIKSNTGDPTDFTGGDAESYDLDINDGDPDGITAIFPPLFGSLYVSKRFSIYRGTPVTLSDGTLIVQFVKITDGLGCNSHAAAVAVESGIMFTSDRGVHIMTSTNFLSGVQTEFKSYPIQNDWVEDVNFRRSQYIQAVYDVNLNSYLAIFPKAGRNLPSDLWGYSVVANKWYRWRDYDQSCIFKYVDVNNRRTQTMVGKTDGRLGFIDSDVVLDHGEPYPVSVQAGIIMPSGGPDDKYAFKFLTAIFVPQVSGKFTISYTINGKFIETLTFSMVPSSSSDALGSGFITGVTPLGAAPSVLMKKNTIKGYGSFYSLSINYERSQDSDPSESFEILGILVDVDSVTKNIGEVSA